MKKEKKDRQFRRKPQFPGGQSAMKQYLQEEINYPPAALEAGIEGSVLVQFTIDYKGEVIFTKVISGLGHGCDEEAERVIRSLRFEADKNRGYHSKTTQTMGIHFRLPRKKDQENAGLTFNYSLSTARPKALPTDQEQDTDSSNAYHYTIEW